MNTTDFPPPFEETVSPDWLDYNGHMNVAYYVLAFDHATDHILDILKLGEAYRQGTNNSVFVVEGHITYQQEVLADTRLRISTPWIEGVGKRIQLYHVMDNAETGERAATMELMLVHVSLESRRSCALPDGQKQNIDAMHRILKTRGRPDGMGKTISLEKNRPATRP